MHEQEVIQMICVVNANAEYTGVASPSSAIIFGWDEQAFRTQEDQR
jgi:hypothetical protein